MYKIIYKRKPCAAIEPTVERVEKRRRVELETRSARKINAPRGKNNFAEMYKNLLRQMRENNFPRTNKIQSSIDPLDECGKMRSRLRRKVPSAPPKGVGCLRKIISRSGIFFFFQYFGKGVPSRVIEIGRANLSN